MAVLGSLSWKTNSAIHKAAGTGVPSFCLVKNSCGMEKRPLTVNGRMAVLYGSRHLDITARFTKLQDKMVP